MTHVLPDEIRIIASSKTVDVRCSHVLITLLVEDVFVSCVTELIVKAGYVSESCLDYTQIIRRNEHEERVVVNDLDTVDHGPHHTGAVAKQKITNEASSKAEVKEDSAKVSYCF